MGDMGLDGDLQRAFVGSDGGIFKPDPASNSLHMISAAAPGSGMNSLQITDVAGTNVIDGNGHVSTTLYFATQDNNIWSSADGGNTWPQITQTAAKATAWKFAAMRWLESPSLSPISMPLPWEKNSRPVCCNIRVRCPILTRTGRTLPLPR